MNADKADVLIVGGGPAGLATAIALRQKGASVTVADAMTPPIDKACGEGLMPDSLQDLAALSVFLSLRRMEKHFVAFGLSIRKSRPSPASLLHPVWD